MHRANASLGLGHSRQSRWTWRAGRGRAGLAAILVASCALSLVACAPMRGPGTGESALPGPDDANPYAMLWPGASAEQGREGHLRFVTVTTRGQGSAAVVANERAFAEPLDGRKRFVKAWVKVDRMDRLRGLELRLSSDRFKTGYAAMNVPLFADPDFNVLRDGSWTLLTFSFGGARVQGHFDRETIDSVGWYVVDRGEGEPVRVSVGAMSLVDEAREGIVSLTFDDGYDEHYEAAERMARHGFAGTAYVIPSSVDHPEYVTREQLMEMQERFGWDIASHHETPLTDFDADVLDREMRGVLAYLSGHGFKAGGHFAYPLGRQDPQVVRPLIRRLFTTARLAGAGPETFPPADPHLLRVVNVTPALSPDDIASAVRRAQQYKEWLILMFHYLVREPAGDLEYSYEAFDRALAEIAASGVRVLPIALAWERCPEIAAAGSACRFEAPVAAPK